jgi:hypothetical protein
METMNSPGRVASPLQEGRLKKNTLSSFRPVELAEVVTPDGILGDEPHSSETGRVL